MKKGEYKEYKEYDKNKNMILKNIYIHLLPSLIFGNHDVIYLIVNLFPEFRISKSVTRD
jgi:hypothetical protein